MLHIIASLELSIKNVAIKGKMFTDSFKLSTLGLIASYT